MNFPDGILKHRLPRRQAERLLRVITQDWTPQGLVFQCALIGHRRAGNSDLLRQLHALLFNRAEGPIPFYYSFSAAPDPAAVPRHFFATLCQQVRAFLMRQEEMLADPSGDLEQELERAGLPLALTELARRFLTLDGPRQLQFAATLGAQFVHQEGRQLCLLLDDASALPPDSPFFPGLQSPHLSWLVTGRSSFLSRVAGARAWNIMRLDPFSRNESVVVANKISAALDVEFSAEAWERWCDVAGTSPWPISALIGAAAASGQTIASIEELGRLYVQELASGTLGNWLASRFEAAIPGRTERVTVAARLTKSVKGSAGGAGAFELDSALWDGLVAEDWAAESAAGPRILPDQPGSTLELDWLTLAASPPEESPQRTAARLLQDFLLRVRERESARASFSAAIRERLLDLPRSGFPELSTAGGHIIPAPRICSVASEPDGIAELYWCYGFRSERPDATESAALLLIAVCEKSPTDRQLEGWLRRLEAEAHLLPRTEESEAPSSHQPSAAGELWVIVPPGASPDAVPSGGRFRFFSWESFHNVLIEAGSDQHIHPRIRGKLSPS